VFDAVWYELTLPYEANVVDINVQAEGAITNGGIVIMDDCNCDDFIGMSFEWIGANGWIHLWSNTVISGPDNNGTILYPLFIDPQQAYTVTFNVTELYVPSFNIYRDGSALESGITGNSYMDSDITEDVEYCYTCEQTMPDGSLSDMSNEACATPTGGVGGETVEDPNWVTGLPFTAFGSTEFYYDNYDESCPYTGSTSPDVVYAYSATEDGVVDASLCGDATDYDTKLYVYENEVGMIAATENGLGGCNDDACSTASYPSPYVSAIEGVILTAGNTYYFVVDGYGGNLGNYELSISSGGGGGDCTDDEFEDDDTKDTATDHGDVDEGSWAYALCQDDNPDGTVQPGGFTAVDWSVVTVAPWTSLTTWTVGDPPESSDIDLWIEDYAGDGLCDWGGGDDLAGINIT
jgi:hypothetical protein